MPAKKKATYQSKAITNKIIATSRISKQINGTFYTVEFAEERSFPEGVDINIEEEKKLLWDAVNFEVDNQIADIYDLVEK